MLKRTDIVCAIGIALVLIATPASARNHTPRHSSKVNTGCIPSSNPDVPPCGVKDEAPVYFPDKLEKPATDSKTAPVKAKKETPATPDMMPNAQTY